jgi:hypothetical protein
MPTANSFKYIASYNNASGTFYGAGFDGIPVIFEFQAQGEVDVTGFHKYQALSGEEICNFYWNFAGINVNASASVPLLEYTFGDPPQTLSNTKDGDVSFNGDLLLVNNSDGEGFDPSQRMLAYPEGNYFTQLDMENDNDPWQFTLRATVSVSSVSNIVRLMSGGQFLGYGMSSLCFAEVTATNRGVFGNQDSSKRVSIRSYFQTNDDDATYSQRDFGGATFWQEEKEEYVDNSDGTAEDPVYILENTTSLSTISPVFFSY